MRSVVFWVRALFMRDRVDREMRREMLFHLKLETEENIRRGMAPAGARRAAMLAFGGVVAAEESVRDERHTRNIESLVGDVRYALRGFARRPKFTGITVALLALGIGANTALFSVVYHELIAPLPFADGNRMVELTATAADGTLLISAPPDLTDDWREHARAVDDVITVGHSALTLGDTSSGGARHAQGAVVPPGVSRFIGQTQELGRDIQPADTLVGAPAVVVLSDGLWRRDFGADPAVIGTSLLVERVQHRIVGVVPPEYRMPFVDESDIFLPRRALPPNPTRTDSLLRGWQAVDFLAKLRAGVSVDDANRELAGFFARWRSGPTAPSFIAANQGVKLDPPRVARMVDLVRPRLRETILLLFGAVSLVLLIACANVANLLLVRAWSRQREFAVRAALGADRSRLMTQVLTESAMLSLAGASAGILVAKLVLHAIGASSFGSELAGARLQPAVLGWSLAVAVITALVFGAIPARFAASRRVAESLKAGARSASGSVAARRFRASLVSIQVALSFVLLAGSGLLVRTLVAMQRADVGLDTYGLVTVDVRFRDKEMSDEARHAAIDAMAARLRATPGIRSVTRGMSSPLHFAIGLGGLQVDGRPLSPGDSLSVIGINSVEPSFFSNIGIRVLRGRVFAGDMRVTSQVTPNEVMINERLARRLWPGGNAVGRRIRYGSLGWLTVVGVVANIEVPGSRDRARVFQFYMAQPAAPQHVMFTLRTSLPATRVDALMQSIAHDASARMRVAPTEALDDQLIRARQSQRSLLTLLGAFAIVALLLAAVGLHAVIAFSMSQRTRELGVRVALGAQSGQVVRLVLREGVTVAACGVIIGVVGALASGHALESFLYGVAPSDPPTITLVGAMLIAVAIAASLQPAWRAAHVDPIDALRAD